MSALAAADPTRAPLLHPQDALAWRSREGLLPLLAFALVAGAYFVVRPGGLWSESDTGAMALAIRAVAGSGHLTPNDVSVYANGYGYQVVSTAILAFTGLSVTALQQLVYPLVTTLLVLPAWTLYRELTGSSRIASLATLLLMLVPEHLFAVLRGSHERLDRAFLLTALWLLVRSLRFRDDRPRFAIHVGLVLLATYGLIATNALFGMSFVLALGTALVLSIVAGRGPLGVRHHARETTRLLRWTAGAAVTLVAIFVLFVYPPVGQSLRALSVIPETLVHLVFTGGVAHDPYGNVVAAWVSPAAYWILSMADYLVLGTSAIIWLWLGWSWLRGGHPASLGVWVLWLLYAAFAAQGAASVVSDRTGALEGNVLYRSFSVFATMAAPLVAATLGARHVRRRIRVIALAAFMVAAISALTKITLDPLVSNKWLFYTASELQGLRWADVYQRGTDTWVGPDERLSAAYALAYSLPINDNRWDQIVPKPGTQAFVLSDVIRLQSVRLGASLPTVGGQNRLYDNGDVQVYRVRPLGAFDR